jgi:hypothetical protein
MSSQAVQRAITRGVAFLAAAQLPTGELPVRASGVLDPSIFPTALAAHSLSFTPESAAIRSRALDFLLREMDPRGLWRHWPAVHPHAHELPPDLDDTSCASAALSAAGRVYPDNRALIIGNRARDGRFRTWKLTFRDLRHPLVLFYFFRTTSARPNDVDAVVNANVLHYLGAVPETRAVVAYLIDILQQNRERQCDKWYDNPFAVWYFFSRALHRAAPETRTIFQAKLAVATPANALEHALLACTLRYFDLPGPVDAILDAQLQSGAWPAAPLYHGGRRRLRNGDFAEPHRDTPYWGSEELTTSFCIEALARA